MSRTSNDDRSDSMNPNNDAYDDSMDNHSNQHNPNNSAYVSSRGGNSESNDDYDDEECTVNPSYLAMHHQPNNMLHNSEISEGDEIEQSFSIPCSVRMMLRYINKQGNLNQVGIEASSGDEILDEVRRLWECSGAWYFKLFHGKVISFEEKRLPKTSEQDTKTAEEVAFLKRLIDKKSEDTKQWEKQFMDSMGDLVEGSHAQNELLKECALSASSLAMLSSILERKTALLLEHNIDSLDTVNSETTEDSGFEKNVYDSFKELSRYESSEFEIHFLDYSETTNNCKVQDLSKHF